MLYLVVGKGLFMKKQLETKLNEWNLDNSDCIFTEIKRSGKFVSDKVNIMLVKQ